MVAVMFGSFALFLVGAVSAGAEPLPAALEAKLAEQAGLYDKKLAEQAAVFKAALAEQAAQHDATLAGLLARVQQLLLVRPPVPLGRRLA